jgi:hypothetical protein
MSFDSNEFAKMRVDFNEDPQNSLGIENSQLLAIQSKIVEIDGNNEPAKKAQAFSDLKKIISDETTKFNDLVTKVESGVKSSYSSFVIDTPLKLLIRKNSNMSPEILTNQIKKLYETKLNSEKSSLMSLYCGESSVFPEWATWIFIVLLIISVIAVIYFFTTKRYSFTVARKV